MLRDSVGISSIVNHSKFLVDVDSLIFNPKYCGLPNDSLETITPFDFSKRKDLTLTVKARIYSSWINEAIKAINRMQTMRNWLIGYYIVEFEQHGKDRAQYGTGLLKKLEERVNRKGLTETLFKWARKFYRLYPQMAENFVSSFSPTMSDVSLVSISATVMHQLQIANNQDNGKSASLMHQFVTPGKTLISHLSFTHMREIMSLDDPFARFFYEQECIKCTWSVRELRRQISTNLYVRAGISSNPEKMLSLPSLQGHDSNEMHSQGQTNGGIRPSRNGQPTLRLHL